MTSLLNGKWKTDSFQPAVYWEQLKMHWEKLSKDISKESMPTYTEALRKFLLGHMSRNQFDDTVENILSKTAHVTSNTLVDKFIAACHIHEFEDLEYENNGENGRKNATLPHASNLNAVLMLACLEKGIEFPASDCAMEFNRIIRQSVSSIILSALTVTHPFDVKEHGFIKFECSPCQNRLMPQDFLDSLAASYELNGAEGLNLLRMEKNESLTNFYYKMMNLANAKIGSSE